MHEIDPAAAFVLRTHIEAFEDLEIVLAILRTGGGPVTLDALVRAVPMPQPQAAEALARLCASGLLVQHAPDSYELSSLDERVRAGLDQLQAEYERNRLAVMRQLSKNAIDRVRTGAIRAFARAFLLGKKDDE